MSRGRAAKIAADFRDLRVEQTFRCRGASCKGNPVAHVVIHEDERVLWVVGGVDQRVRHTLEQSFAEIQRHTAARETETTSIVRDLRDRFVEWHSRYVAQFETDGGIDVEPWAQCIGPSNSQTDLRAPCRRCHRGVWLRIDPAGAVSYAPAS